MAFDLAQLRTFRTVAETSSFTRAAARLYVTQSAVSHQIKALEEELGEALFIRTRHGVRLAEAGQAVLEHVDRIFEEVEALRRRLGHDGDQPVGRVRAAAATQALVHLFAPHFRAFMEAYPRVEVVFRSTVSTDRTVADILAGVADVGFASKPVYSATLQVTELFEDELLLVVSPDAPAGRRGARDGEGHPQRAADPLRAGRIDPACERPVLRAGGHQARPRARVERHRFHQADGEERRRHLAAAGVGHARGGAHRSARARAHQGPPAAALGRHALARTRPAVGDPRVHRVHRGPKG